MADETMASLPGRLAAYITAQMPRTSRAAGVATAVRVTDHVRVRTGRNRFSTTSSQNEPEFVDPGLGQFPTPPSRSVFEAQLSRIRPFATVYVTTGTPYSAIRERLDGAMRAALVSVEKDWPRIFGKAVKVAT